MKLLFVSLTFPVPANNGHKIRNWALLRALARAGHQITMLTFADPAEEDAEGFAQARKVCQSVQVVPLAQANVSAANNYIGRARALFSKLPYSVERFRSEEMRRLTLAALASGEYVAVVSETCYALINMPDKLPIPLVLDNHNVEHTLVKRYVDATRHPVRRGYAYLEWRKMLRWEREAYLRSDVIMACSEEDRSAIAALCPGKTPVVVPNVVDADTFVTDTEADPATVMYVGGMDWYPNRDAVEFFAGKIFPELRSISPGVKFVVAGRSPSKEFRQRFAGVEGMEFTGTLRDIRTEVAKATVCVVPLRIGSGTRLKILEAAAMAKPIVSTRLGAEGLDFADGEEIVFADEPKDFARAVAGLLGDAARRRSLGKAARRKLEQKYSFPALRGAVARAVEQLEGPLAAVDARASGDKALA